MNKRTFRTTRRLADMSAEEYAQAIGVSRQLVNHIEQGRKSITRTTVNKVRSTFGDEYIDRVERFIEETEDQK
jgi:DNA-binding XRE family transcriptional regulator